MTLSLRTVLACCFALAVTASVRAEEIDNPQYKSWSAYKPGTWVKYNTVADMAGQKTETQTTIKLVEVTAEKAVLEMAISMTMGGQKMDMPAQKQDVPAKVTKAEPPANAPKADVKEGTDDVTIAGKTYKCKTTESTMKQGDNTTVAKTWMCDDVPSGLVKMQSTMEGAVKGNTTMELAGVEIVK